MPNDGPDKNLLQTITNLINNMANEGTGYDTLINVLALLCLFYILSRSQAATNTTNTVTAPPQNTSNNTNTNPLNSIIGELTKNASSAGNGPPPDMLSTLLPLLNNPQIKSKLNPSNISTILGLMNNLGGGNNKPSNQDNSVQNIQESPTNPEQPVAAITASLSNQQAALNNNAQALEKKDLGRHLNWKTNF